MGKSFRIQNELAFRGEDGPWQVQRPSFPKNGPEGNLLRANRASKAREVSAVPMLSPPRRHLPHSAFSARCSVISNQNSARQAPHRIPRIELDGGLGERLEAF